MQPTISQLATTYAAAADAVTQAPATPAKEQLIAERNAAATAYFRAAFSASPLSYESPGSL